MKFLLIAGLAMSLASHADTGTTSQGSGYAPNNGTAQPGNPGTFTTPKAGLGESAPSTTGAGTDIDSAGTSGTGSATAATDVIGAEEDSTLEKANTSPNPVPKNEDDLTLQSGKTQTGPYKTPGNKQSQESTEEELDYRVIPSVDHDEQNASETP